MFWRRRRGALHEDHRSARSTYGFSLPVIPAWHFFPPRGVYPEKWPKPLRASDQALILNGGSDALSLDRAG
jgi:hypothetical protein